MGLTTEQAIFFVILAVAIGLLVAERLRPDLIALLIILGLAITRLLPSDQALSGFHSEPAIVIASMFVLSAGLQHTGVSDQIGQWISRQAGGGLTRVLAVLMPAAALASAFTHHVSITAAMLPVTIGLARERKVPASKLLMPMAIASSLGTTITILGAPSFLVSSELLRQAGRPGLGVFSIAPIGLSLTLVGIAYVLLIGRHLLPNRGGAHDPAAYFRLDEYFTEVRVLPSSPLVGKTLDEQTFTTVGWLRGGRQLSPPFRNRRLKGGDVLLVRATPDQLVGIRNEPGVELEPLAQYRPDDTAVPSQDGEDERADSLVQAIVAPGSSLVGRTIAETDLRRRRGVLVLGLWRRVRFMPQELAHVRLREGDVLVLQADPEAIARLSRDRDFLMLVPFQAEERRPRRAVLATAIMLGTILTASLNWLSLGIASLAGATAMVLSGSVRARQAYRAIDVRMFVFVAGAIPLGLAMKQTGAADLLAGWLRNGVSAWDERLILLALFATVGVVVQFMGSDSATVALFGPVAIALAGTLGHAPEAYIVTVAMAAVTATLTPMSHHNLLIYGPGGYRFADYTRLGGPLTILLAAVTATLAPFVWH